jgi:hypothetical protein
MRIYFAEPIGRKQSVTPEGFLLCEDVPIARTGVQHYQFGELIEDGVAIKAANDGIIYAHREADDVFRPETVASFEGKTVTNDHPDEDVTPANWKQYAVGHLQNVHQGEGAQKDLLLADMILKDADAIAAVRDGKREVSCGYDFDVVELSPGRVRQTNIIGNHVALVEQGRCGPRCSIGDRKMTKRTLWDRVSTALKAKDEEALKEAIEGKAEDAELDPGETSKGGSHVVNINLNHGGSDKAKDEEGEGEKDEEKDKDDPLTKIADSVGGLCKRMDDFGARLEKLEGGKADDADDPEDDDTGEARKEEGEQYGGQAKDKAKDGKGKDGKAKDGKAKDSATLAAAFQDTLARAEILSPGIKVPAFDKAMAFEKTSEILCGIRRRALDKAFATDGGKAVIEPLLEDGKLDTKGMSCKETRIMFNAASEGMKRANANDDDGEGTRARDTGTTEIKTIDGINKSAKDFWAKRGGVAN